MSNDTQHRRTATGNTNPSLSSSNSPRSLTPFASALTDATPLSSPTANPATLQLGPSAPIGSDNLKSTPLTRDGQPLPGPPAPLNLAKLASGVGSTRSGSVLSRGLILKSDYRYSAPPAASQTEASAFADPEHERRTHAQQAEAYHLGGATNFRDGGLGIWGTAQPSETGILSVLTLLRSKHDPTTREKGKETVWCCLREEPIIYIGAQPFVLREAAHPTRTYSISNRAENLEEIEARLKQDVLKESRRYGGLVLVHSEDSSSSHSTPTITPTWVSADNIRTVRELFSQIRDKGYNVSFHRTPVSRDQSPGDGYLDHYTSLISTVPTTSSLVFNCGVGVVRTTFAMSAALIVRRKQLLEEGAMDPYGLAVGDEEPDNIIGSPTLRSQDKSTAERMLKGRLEQAERDRSLLRLMHVLSKSLPAGSQGTILSLLSLNSGLMENLRSALLGKYDIVLSLLSTLDDGSATKKVVDSIIDHCDALVNLRESVLAHRVRYASLALLDEQSAAEHRSQALAALQRYFFLVTFGAFVAETPLPTSTSTSRPPTFSSWLKHRSEIQSMVSRMNKTGHFFIFSPVYDLSAIARGGDGGQGVPRINMATMFDKGRFRDVAPGGDVVGDEFAHQIVRNRSGVILRSGMILKDDQWVTLGENQEQVVRGAINYRRVPGGNTYGLSQPTHDGIKRVLEMVKSDLKSGAKSHWLNLREEPLVYINGSPYVLRSQAVSLRNVKSYRGITASRLEVLEERLKSDVLAELQAFDGRILLATEAEDGSVNQVWETIEDESQVQTLKQVMDGIRREMGLEDQLQFKRVPITSEAFPEFSDLRDILETVTTASPEDALIVNDQLGRGRTTRTLVIIKMVTDWLRHGPKPPRSNRSSYTVINNLLRAVPRTGQEVKDAVDEAITACGHPFDMLESIEDARQAAEDAQSDFEKEKWVARGLKELRAYFFLILLMCYLNETRPETWRDLGQTSSYEDYIRQRPVFKTIERELDSARIEALVPLERPLTDGAASNDEVADFVAQRSGRVLSAFTLLKSDFFSGLQKMSLPERVDGAPNFRRVQLDFSAAVNDGTKSTNENGPLVYGTGMPTTDGLRRALEKMGAKEMTVTWTSMREEPVLYIRSRPHVLRLFDQPLENVITTGVTTATVEAMEAELKRDLLREREKTGGKVLLHDEIEENGTFTVTAMWEEIQPEDVLTPREVFAKMQSEGLKVDYDRLPVTDETAPIPGIFSRIEQRCSAALIESNKATLTMNCQMGRGRTTTGMVACALVYNILFARSSASDLAASFIVPDHSHNSSWDGRESDPYLEGEYKVVLQLVGVLQNGKMAKKLTDRAIDNMEAVQNLRTAIFSFKLRVEASEAGSKKREKLFDQALNYLYRYATLIVFANFLLDKAAALDRENDSDEDDDEENDDEKKMRGTSRGRRNSYPPFAEYLEARPEIKRILSRRTLD
ncbi:uncharacterized protein JCM6883_005515 [Sporobolomyces salmoneus]|uniref:uncharacterized protein n=1 Tax=Sporobolomyces salmoneus TaxID=183962 RepID=UPI00316CC312